MFAPHFPACFVLVLVTACTEWLIRYHRNATLWKKWKCFISYEFVTVYSVKFSMCKLLRIVWSRQEMQPCGHFRAWELLSFWREPRYSLLDRRSLSWCEQGGEETAGTQTWKCSGMQIAFTDWISCITVTKWTFFIIAELASCAHIVHLAHWCSWPTFTLITLHCLLLLISLLRFENYPTCWISIAKVCVCKSVRVLQNTCQASYSQHRMSVLCLGGFGFEMSLGMRAVLAEIVTK